MRGTLGQAPLRATRLVLFCQAIRDAASVTPFYNARARSRDRSIDPAIDDADILYPKVLPARGFTSYEDFRIFRMQKRDLRNQNR